MAYNFPDTPAVGDAFVRYTWDGEKWVFTYSYVPSVLPTNTVPPVISPTPPPKVGNTLTASSGTWTGTSGITYAYQWKRGATNIGTNANNYTLISADVGAMITVVVTATNVVGNASVTSAAVGPVTNVYASTYYYLGF